MAPLKHAIAENDVIALCDQVGEWPSGTVGTAISIYDDAALVEVSEQTAPGRAIDTLVVPFEQLELRWQAKHR